MENTAPVKDMKFLFGGKAIFTVSSPTGERFTFRVSKMKANPRFQQEGFSISVMTGSDNESHYTYMGLLQRDGTIKLTKASIKLVGGGGFGRWLDELPKVRIDKRYKVAQWAIKRVLLGDIAKYEGYEIRHAGRCCVCGRTLTTPESIDSGIGPKCAGRY